jgi:hypothetical protein
METYSDRFAGYAPTAYGVPYDVSKKAPHIGHKKHLCNMCESGECTLDQIKPLVKDAKFICKVCGRVAVAEENLCEPLTL